jgi:hypothetical protein
MAAKYYAEIVRATPATKNICGEQVIYNVTVIIDKVIIDNEAKVS